MHGFQVRARYLCHAYTPPPPMSDASRLNLSEGSGCLLRKPVSPNKQFDRGKESIHHHRGTPLSRSVARPRGRRAKKAIVYTLFLGKQGERVYTIGPERRVYTIEPQTRKKKNRSQERKRHININKFFPVTARVGGGLPTVWGGVSRTVARGQKFMCGVRNPRNIDVFVRVPGREKSGSRPGGSVTGVTEKLFMCQMFMCLFRPLRRVSTVVVYTFFFPGLMSSRPQQEQLLV